MSPGPRDRLDPLSQFLAYQSTQKRRDRVAYGCAEDAGEGAVEPALHDVPLQHLPLVELGDLRHAAMGAHPVFQSRLAQKRKGARLPPRATSASLACFICGLLKNGASRWRLGWRGKGRQAMASMP